MAGDTPLVLALVGTDYHKFDRLVDWVDAWFVEQPQQTVSCIVQHGAGAPPRAASGSAYFERNTMRGLLARANVIVCHGGPSTIVESRRRGLVPLVLPRRKDLGEHVDDHQYRFSQIMAERGLIHLVESAAALEEAIERGLREPHTCTVDPSSEPDPSLSAARLGLLVDGLIARRRGRGALPAA